MTQKIFDVFGVVGPDLVVCAGVVEQTSGVHLELHNSAYKGGDYYRAKICGGELTVINNFIQLSGTWAEEEFREFSFLLCVDMPQDADAVRSVLVGRGRGLVVWLSRTVVEGKTMRTTTRANPTAS